MFEKFLLIYFTFVKVFVAVVCVQKAVFCV